MQDTEWVDAHLTELLAAGQVPLMKLEIEVGVDNWIDLCALDTKNYVEGVTLSLGGASMTPNPIGGTLSAMLSNEGSIFHPKHPSSGYEAYLKTGRKVRISIGAKYNGTPYYWQRVIGFIDEPRFEALAQKVSISGADYMKLLEDTELRSPDNYWGDSETYPSIPSDGLVGSEIYKEADAMTYPAEGEDDYIGNWETSNCTFVSFEDDGGGSTYVGKVTDIGGVPRYVKNLNVGNAEEGKEYRVKFKHEIFGGTPETNTGRIEIWQASGRCKRIIYNKTDDWAEETFYFTALDTGAIEMRFYFTAITTSVRLDQFSIREFVPYEKRYYELLDVTPDSKGPYFVTYDGDPVWQGEVDEGWYYDPEEETGEHPHPAEIVYFDINKTIVSGKDIIIYYFTHQKPEDVVADILVLAGITETLEFTATPDIDHIDKVWFGPGTTCLNAIKKICERCDYRFHFSYAGIPVFKPKPAPETVSFAFTAQKHIASFSNYQDRNEVKNRIVIEGMKRAEPVNKEETMPPELKGEAYNQTSIDTYGERTLTIKNHLFQDQDSINAMCASLLAEYKDPKWYSDVEVPFNPVPLELGDKMGWKERLSPVLEIPQTGIIRDIKIESFDTTYKCQIV